MQADQKEVLEDHGLFDESVRMRFPTKPSSRRPPSFQVIDTVPNGKPVEGVDFDYIAVG